MRAVIQRVTHAGVMVDGLTIGEIKNGLLVFLGIEDSDNEKDIVYLADKIINLRIFEDDEGKMNRSLQDVGGELLVVSQFTLYGDCRKGRRPSYDRAAKPDFAKKVYSEFIEYCKVCNVNVETGEFQATMMVEICNDGPVTLLLDSKKEF